MKFRIYKYTDTAITQEAFIDDYISAIWTTRFNSCGEFQLQLSASETTLGTFELDMLVERVDVAGNEVCIVEKIEISETAESGKTITLSGRSAAALMARRVMIFWIINTFPNFWGYATKGNGLTYFKQTKINKVLQEIVCRFCVYPNEGIPERNSTGQIQDSDLKNRVIPFLACDDADILSANETQINMAEKGANVLDKIFELGTAHNIGVKSVLTNGKIHIQFFDGVDRKVTQSKNSPVIFSKEYENLASQQRVSTYEGKATVIYAEGCGEGTNRTAYCTEEPLIQFDDENPTTGLKRFEIYYDHRDLGYMDENNNPTIDGESSGYYNVLSNDAEEKLSEAVAVSEIQIVPVSQFEFRKDFNIGDEVTVDTITGREATRIIEVIESEDAVNGYVLTISTSENALNVGNTTSSATGAGISTNGGGEYHLPTATYTTLGGVIVDSETLGITAEGTISVKSNGHKHQIENITGLQNALNAKSDNSAVEAMQISLTELSTTVDETAGKANSALTEIGNLTISKANKASIISEINASEETEVISAAKVETVTTCATGSFINDTTTVVRCQTNFGTKPAIFKLYFVDEDGGLTLGAEFRPGLDTDLQKFIYYALPITLLNAGSTGIVGVRFSDATGKTFIWEAYR